MGYTHLTAEERYQIDDLLREGFSQSLIAKKLGRSGSTLSRELNRNKGGRGWRPRQAENLASERLSTRGAKNVKRVSAEAWDYAKKHLKEDQWSPEQIQGRLKLKGLESISHETIYQRILEDKKNGGSLYTELRCKKKRKKRYGSSRGKRSSIPGRIDIDARPAIVETRERLGDWEGDTVIGTHTRGAVIATMVERKSRFTRLVKAKNKTTVEVINKINERMQPIARLVHTVTLDNGKEFSLHKKLSNELKTKIFFAKPYHSWERGLNENTNGLVRQYFPKKISFDNISEAAIQEVENKLNNRPRKCLGYRTPFEIWNQECKKNRIGLHI